MLELDLELLHARPLFDELLLRHPHLFQRGAELGERLVEQRRRLAVGFRAPLQDRIALKRSRQP
jgi:hypothetical protein